MWSPRICSIATQADDVGVGFGEDDSQVIALAALRSASRLREEWCPMFRLSLLAAALMSVPGFAADAPKKILLIGSAPDNHSFGTHEYLPAMELLAKLLK